ncbi:4Fe-4S binding protein [Chakrabartyella piscis]|uniref:4Fe-4S binding protein n=1 Tax=Chakrabartyella piscis TaxID=2918914 RepID=UPI002958B49E|nr:4Fe-4S binding protein [Chakrabartyella piscis]
MSVYAVYFSPTGATEAVAMTIAGAMSQEVYSMNLCDREMKGDSLSLGAEDICILAAPAFGGRIPTASVERFQELSGNGAKAVLVATYGNREYEDTMVELEDIALGCGFVVVAGIAAITEHSIAREFGAGRPNAEDVAVLKEFSLAILKKIKETKDLSVKIPGDRPYKTYGGASMTPKGNHKCVGCGACAKKCPVSAIPMDTPNQTNADVCIACMRCVSVCPMGARDLSKVMLLAVHQKLKKACSVPKENKLFL